MPNTKKAIWVAGALLLITGAVMASNMGFKFVPNLATPDPNLYSLSLPYNNNYTNAQQVCADVPPSGCVQMIRRTPSGGIETWFGSFGTNFPITKGEGYFISVPAPVSTWVVVGSHDPAFQKNFSSIDPDLFTVSIPYHTTATNAQTLFAQVPGAVQVIRIGPSGGTETWFGSFGTNFPVTIGESYLISVNTPVLWTPPHY